MSDPRRNLPRTLATTFFFIFLHVWAQAQSDTVEVRMAVDRLFTGMRTGDSSLVSQSFVSDATLQSISTTPDGKIRHTKDTAASFIKAVGTPHPIIWDEQIYDLKIQTDGPMATVWAPYKFYLGEKFSHCGVNAFTLIRTESGWKIASITDTRRKDECR